MYVVVFEVDIKQDWVGDADRELDQLATMVKSLPDFVRASWATDGRRSISFIVFESEQSARSVADNAAMPPDASVTLRAASVYEIVREA